MINGMYNLSITFEVFIDAPSPDEEYAEFGG
jgi:hypothetical protein